MLEQNGQVLMFFSELGQEVFCSSLLFAQEKINVYSLHFIYVHIPVLFFSVFLSGLAKRVGARLLLASTSEVYGGKKKTSL